MIKQQRDNVIMKVPKNLQCDLKYDIYKKFLKDITFFNKCFSQKTIEKMISCMNVSQYLPGEIIFNEGDHQSE